MQFGSGSIVCEIINPSDPYTLRTDDFLTAAVAIALLGDGKYGIQSVDDGSQSPVMFGWEEWLQERGVKDPGNYVRLHAVEMAEILESALIGDARDRQLVESTLSLLPEEERANWLDEFHNQRRSSLNDIRESAARIAGKLRVMSATETQE